MPKISLIIPVYGVENYIERCCVSIFTQTYKDFEVIFVNDATKDKSEEILLDVIERYRHLGIESKLIRHTSNQGISATRETGMNAATGDYLLYIDSDDYIDPNMLELLVTKAADTNAEIVYCDYYEVKAGSHLYRDQSLDVDEPLSITAAMLRGDIRWCPWNKLFKRSLVVEHDIHWPVGVNVGEDLAVIPRIFSYAKKIEHVNEALYFYNRDNVNSYLNVWSLSSCYQNIKAVESISEFFQSKFPDSELTEALKQTKLMTRYLMLYSFNSELVKLVPDTFPETNNKVFSYQSTSLYWKIVLYLVVNRMNALSSAALKAIWWFKQIRSYKSAV